MSESVFYPAFGNRPDRIVGREQVINSILKGLQFAPGHRDRATLLLGQRGTGKTALLLEIADRASSAGFITAHVTASTNMLEEIIELVQVGGAPYVTEKKSKIKGFSAGAMGFSVGLTFSDEVRDNYGFRVKLSLLCDKLAESGKGILILVDEVQSSSEAMRQLAITYQHLVGDGKNIAMCMAGLPSAISHVINDDVLTFLNRARKIRLEALPLGEVGAYFGSVFQKLGVSISASTLRLAAQATQGFPYLLQLVGYYLVELSDETRELTSEHVRVAEEYARQDFVETVILATLNPLSEQDIAFLEAMSSDKQGISSTGDIAERMSVSAGYVQQYRRRLLDAGVIASPKRGQLEFTVPYLGEYLRGEAD